MKLKSAMSSIALCLAATALLSAAELKEFGILGQSQPEGAEVLREPFCGSAVNDPQGNVWFVNGNGVYRIAGGERTAKRVLQSAGRLMTDGEEIFLQRNTVLLRLQTGPDGRVNTRQALDFRKGFTCTGVAHAATKKGFGEKLKYFALDGKEGLRMECERGGARGCAGSERFPDNREGGLRRFHAGKRISAGFHDVSGQPGLPL